MRAHEKAGLTLQKNGITFKNGLMVSEDELLEEDIIEGRDYKKAKDVRTGQKYSVLPLGEGLVTLNDTDYIFPYNRDHFWEDGDLLGPAEVLENSYRAFKAIDILKEMSDEFSDSLSEDYDRFRDIELDSEDEELLDLLIDVSGDLRELYRERIDSILNRWIEYEGEWGKMYNIPEGQYTPLDSVFPRPEHVDYGFDTDWEVGSVEEVPDFSDFNDVLDLMEEGRGVSSVRAVVKTEDGKLYSDENIFFEDHAFKLYDRAALTLAQNDITFKNGVFTTEEDLKEAEIIESSNYRQAWDLVYGRPDSIVHLGHGIITFNDTDFSFPWSEKLPEDETLFPENEEIYRDENDLRPPLDILRRGWKASEKALDLFDEGEYGELEQMLRKRARNDDFSEEPRFDQESFPVRGEVDPNEFAGKWSYGEIDGVPELGDYKEFLNTVTGLLDIDDVVFKIRGSGSLRGESSFSDTRLEISGDQLVRSLEKSNLEENSVRNQV